MVLCKYVDSGVSSCEFNLDSAVDSFVTPMKLFYLFNPTALISGRHYKHLIRLTIIHTCTISTSMTTSSATFIASIGKKEANILGISIKQLLIPNSDFFPIHMHTLKHFFW